MRTYVSDGIDIDVVFGAFRMGYKRFDKEMTQDTLDGLDLLALASASLNPGTGFWPALVQSQEAALPPTLDQLIGLCNEFGTVSQQPGVGNFSLVEDGFDGSIFGKVEYSESWRWVVGFGRR